MTNVVKIQHPDVEATGEVLESSVEFWQTKGWEPVEVVGVVTGATSGPEADAAPTAEEQAAAEPVTHPVAEQVTYENLTREALLDIAKSRGLEADGRTNKAELVRLLSQEG